MAALEGDYLWPRLSRPGGVAIVIHQPFECLASFGISEFLVAQAKVKQRLRCDFAVQSANAEQLLVGGDRALDVAFDLFLMERCAENRLGIFTLSGQ
ncbi:MAG: hypothetical protein ABIQ44_06030 [Chloroflexia bacterium]